KSLIPDTKISYFGFSDTIMSDSEDSTVTYTTVSSPYEGRSGEVSPGVDGPPPSGDDADEEDEDQDEDDDDEDGEHPASANSIPPPLALYVTARISFRPQPPTLSFTKEDAERFLAMPIPPPLPLTPLSSPLP
nr:hypothetical protein [Tanacetum cinerariifolium]